MATPAHETELDDELDGLEADALHALGAPLARRLTVPAGSDAERLDKALARLLPDVSRSRIKQWIEGGSVRLNDRVPAARTLVLAGDTIAVAPDPASLVRGCFAGAARGWVYVAITLGARASQTSLVESSPLADEVTSCVVEKLRALHALDPAISAPPALVYVSSG